MSQYDSIKQKLAQQKVVILDGGIGTEILRRNVSWADHQVTRLPEVIRGIHEDYIKAGADVITTNTFQLSRRSFLNHFKDVEHMRHIGARDLETRAETLLQAAVKLTLEARERVNPDQPVAIAASVTTAEWCFRPDLAPPAEEARSDYEEIVRTMAESGVDLILLETLNSIPEAKVALEVVRSAGLPGWLGFVCDENGKLFSGETLAEAVAVLEPLGPDVILVNCAPPDHTSAGMRELTAKRSAPTGAFAHIGRFNPPEWMFTDEYPPARYADEAQRWFDMGARVIGGCCGTTPEHIAELRKRFT